MNGLGIILIGAAGAVIVIGFAAFLRWEDRRDDRALRRRNPFPEPEHPGFSDIQRPPEIAHEPSIHELPPLGDAVWHQYPVTSPAAPPPPLADYTGAAPGTAAAAAAPPSATPPAPAPPPLPDPAYAAANPGCWPLAWLESDTFVAGFDAIQGGA